MTFPALFHPGYIGGWSAAEHWDLTEQMFRSLVVYTARPTRPRTQMIQGISYILRRVKPEQIFGMHPVWHGKVKVLVSDVHRTVVDMLDDPGSGGGIRPGLYAPVPLDAMSRKQVLPEPWILVRRRLLSHPWRCQRQRVLAAIFRDTPSASAASSTVTRAPACRRTVASFSLLVLCSII